MQLKGAAKIGIMLVIFGTVITLSYLISPVLAIPIIVDVAINCGAGPFSVGNAISCTVTYDNEQMITTDITILMRDDGTDIETTCGGRDIRVSSIACDNCGGSPVCSQSGNEIVCTSWDGSDDGIQITWSLVACDLDSSNTIITVHDQAYTAFDNTDSFAITDTTNPVISITTPTKGQQFSGGLNDVYVEIRGTASDLFPNTLTIDLSIFGGNLGTYTSWNFTNATMAPGEYTVIVTATDTSSNSKTDTVTFSVAGGDSCTYTSGNYEPLCSDNCVITSDIDLGGNNFSFTGSVTFTLDGARLHNYVLGHISNGCAVTVINGGEIV